MSELAAYINVMGAHFASTGRFSFPIPDATFSTVPRETLNAAAPSISKQQIQIAAAGAVIGFGYGRARLALRIMFPIIDDSLPNCLLVPGFICRGPIDAIESIQLDNTALHNAISVTHYTGSQTVVDPQLFAAWAVRERVYADVMAGYAYSVLKLPPTAGINIGNLTVTVRLLKVYDPRLDSTNGGTGSHRLADPLTWAWSQNPVLALAHFLTTAGFGPQESMDWASVITCANIADEEIGTSVVQTRRKIGIFFDQQQGVKAIEETLRSYAGVFVVREDNLVRLVPDAPASIVYTFTNAAPANYLLDSLEIKGRSRANAPTVVTIRWTDTAQTPWATREVQVKANGVENGTKQWVESVIDWPGCQEAGMAKREGLRRINEFNLADTYVQLTATDEGLRLRRGDVVGITDGEGLSNKPYRVTDGYPVALGRWLVSTTEYQAGLYSNEVYDGPVIPDTDLPDPNNPPQLANLVLTEESFQLAAFGTWMNRIKATWDAPNWPFVRQYQVTIMDELGNMVETGVAGYSALPEYHSGPMEEGKLYAVRVALVSMSGGVATGVSGTIWLTGTRPPPSSVASITAALLNGVITASWPAVPDYDVSTYEVRVGLSTDTWSSATLYSTILNALTATIPALPAGSYLIFAKARDSVRSAAYPYGQESATAAQVALTISVNESLFAKYTFTTPTLTRMSEVTLEGQERRWVGSSVPGFFGDITPTVATQTDVIALDFLGDNTGPTEFRTEYYDVGEIMLISAEVYATVTDLGNAGTVVYLQASDDAVSYTEQAVTLGVAAGASGRYFRVSIRNNSATAPGPCPLITNGMPRIAISGMGLAPGLSMKLNRLSTLAEPTNVGSGLVRSFLALEAPTGAL